MSRTYNLFISHAWKYHDEYERIVDLLNKAPYFSWKNYSSPRHDPAIDSNSDEGRQELEDALRNQIRPTHCVVVLAGLYVSYSYWIQKEIDIAQGMGKPIIGVIPRGNEKIPEAVRKAAVTIVGWKTDSIVSAIREYSIKGFY